MFIPIGDDNSRRRKFPFFVWLIFAANAVVWFMELSLGDRFVMAYSAIPYELTKFDDLVTPVKINIGGESVVLEHTPGPSPIYLTLLTAMFMHGSWMHIIGNMMYLLIFADQIEDELGHFRFLIFYLACGLAAGLAHIAADPQSVIPSLGASGAIAGVLGAYLVRHPMNPVKVLFYGGITYIPAFVVLGFWVVLQVFGQFEAVAGAHSEVAYMAHIGGFIAGVALIRFFMPKRKVRI